MNLAHRWHVRLALLLLLATLLFGLLAGLAYMYPAIGQAIAFKKLRPAHVSAALFWIITGASAAVVHHRTEAFRLPRPTRSHAAFVAIWAGSIVAILVAYALNRFGGREYWEFPPLLGVPVLVAWLLFMVDHFRAWRHRPADPPLYVWMWTTGVVFFLITFLEQNLWQIPWFRNTYMRELTVQWKSNGAMVGAWNQMIYGSALYLMTRIGGDDGIARGPKAFAFWFLGLSNLMFNWGHHIYSAPTAGWIRHTAYAISMAEWVLLIDIIRGFKAKLAENRRLGHLTTYRFLVTAELWVFLNLALALLMSFPFLNRYTHGTHVTVAHAMGTTVGINTMILLGSLSWMLRIDQAGAARRWMERGRLLAVYSLLVFWVALIVAGLIKGWRMTALGITDHTRLMAPVDPVLQVFVVAGFGVAAGLAMAALPLLAASFNPLPAVVPVPERPAATTVERP